MTDYARNHAELPQARDALAGDLGLPVLEGIPNRISHKRNSLLRGSVKVLDSPFDLLFEAVLAFQAVLEADQVPVWILAFGSAERWGDCFPLPFGDTGALCFNSAVRGGGQVRVAFAVQGTRRISGLAGRRAFLGRPLPLILRPHPAGLLGRLIPLLRGSLLLGHGLLRRNRLLRRGRHAQVDVILLPRACLDLDATGPGGPAAATLIVAVIGGPGRRAGRVLGGGDSHRTSQPPCDTGRDTTGTIQQVAMPSASKISSPLSKTKSADRKSTRLN